MYHKYNIFIILIIIKLNFRIIRKSSRIVTVNDWWVMNKSGKVVTTKVPKGSRPFEERDMFFCILFTYLKTYE